ncbi:MAG: recombinase RecA [Spirochaetota bacterium]|nr:recombinase RecA [Spirochaetota bacterium]
MTKEKEQSLNATVTQLEKQYGKGTIMRLGSKEKVQVPFIPTGALTLDVALGIGGVPRGRVVEIYGPESSGKTTLTLQIAANTQKLGGVVGFVDAEHALDPAYAEKIGVDVDNLYIAQPDYGEQALEIVEALVRSSAVDLIVVDSVAALVPKAEIEGNMGDSHMGLQARLMSQALRKLTGIISRTNTCIIFINQIRMKIGITFGSPETTTGGNALKFYSSVRLDIRKVETLKKGEDMIGNHVRVKVVKNKMAPPFKKAEFDIMFAEGISSDGCLLEAAVEAEIIKKSGTWYSYGDERIGQGKDNAKIFLKDNPDKAKAIETAVRAHFGLVDPPPINSEGPSEEPKDEKKKTTKKSAASVS